MSIGEITFFFTLLADENKLSLGYKSLKNIPCGTVCWLFFMSG